MKIKYKQQKTFSYQFEDQIEDLDYFIGGCLHKGSIEERIDKFTNIFYYYLIDKCNKKEITAEQLIEMIGSQYLDPEFIEEE